MYGDKVFPLLVVSADLQMFRVCAHINNMMNVHTMYKTVFVQEKKVLVE